MALWPLHRAFRARRVVVATYQAASGAGAKGMEELLRETHRFLHGETPRAEVFAHPLPFNVIPHIDAFQENGYTREEMKVVWETHKIFGDDSIKISTTAVRVPTLRAHAEAASVEFAEPVTPEAAREVLKGAPGVELVDEPEKRRYPMPLTASGKWDVEVGRIRKSLAFENGPGLLRGGGPAPEGGRLKRRPDRRGVALRGPEPKPVLQVPLLAREGAFLLPQDPEAQGLRPFPDPPQGLPP
jgi:aspartate-semialdehyde dehydrogenase